MLVIFGLWLSLEIIYDLIFPLHGVYKLKNKNIKVENTKYSNVWFSLSLSILWHFEILALNQTMFNLGLFLISF